MFDLFIAIWNAAWEGNWMAITMIFLVIFSILFCCFAKYLEWRDTREFYRVYWKGQKALREFRRKH